jgi:hypothetical protein
MAFKVGNPYKVFAGMVKVKAVFVRRGSERFRTSELKLFNKVFVGSLSESLAFFGI